MAPSCFVDPMECIFEERSMPILYKRAPPTPSMPDTPVDHPDTISGSGSGPSNTVVIAVAVSVGSLVLILALTVFYCCVRKRRASGRIGHMQKFLPTFMDQEKSDRYFQNVNTSATTLVGANNGGSGNEKSGTYLTTTDPSKPSNVHSRVRSAPLALAKGGGVFDHRNRHLNREESLGQFQQISLISEPSIAENPEELTTLTTMTAMPTVTPRRAPSNGSTRARAATVAAPAPLVTTSLHRSVSLNRHSPRGPIMGRAPIEEELLDDSGRFPDGERLAVAANRNRLSVLLDLELRDDESLGNNNNNVNDSNINNNRFSAMSYVSDGKYDPLRISTSSLIHHNSPTTMRSREVSTEVIPNSVQFYGDKQELDDDFDITSYPYPQPQQ
ncbi:hypothetical protein BGW38_006105, partial [Lunasporangiospora selenospora]